MGGVIATILGMILFPLAPNIAGLIFVEGTEANRVAAIVIAILAFCVLDLAVNTTMWPGTFVTNFCCIFVCW